MTCLSKLYFAQSNTYFGTNLQHTLHTQTKGSRKKKTRIFHIGVRPVAAGRAAALPDRIKTVLLGSKIDVEAEM